MAERNTQFWVIQGPGWVLCLLLAVGQGIAAIDYDLAVKWGLQDPSSIVGDIGVAFWWGFALGDLVFYIPILAIGLVGHATSKQWAPVPLAAALGITAYWPVVVLAAVWDAQGAPGWHLPLAITWLAVLPIVVVWAVWGLWVLLGQNKA